MKLLWSYVSQHKKVLAGSLVLASINQLFSLLDPQVFRLMIDKYATKAGTISERDFVVGIALLLLAYVGVALVSRIAKNFQDFYINVLTQKVGAQMYADSLAHSLSLPYLSFEDQRSGELLQKLNKARSDSQNFINNFINQIFLSLIGILFVLVYAFVVHWLIGVVYFSLIPVLGFSTFYLSRKIGKAQKDIVAQQADLMGSTTETLRNVELVKSLGLETQEIKRLNQVNDDILKLELKKVKIIRAFSFIQGTILNAMRALLILVMMWLIGRQDITLGQFFTLFIYSFFIFQPLSNFGAVAAQYQETTASLEQLNQILQQESELKPVNPKVVGALQNIVFDQASFKYNSGQQHAVDNISLKIKAGDTIAFVGPSGSGKTTLIKLLVGLYKPTQGQLLFNNTDAQIIDLDVLRQRIGLVSQDTQLFAGTIRDNLLFVNPKASDFDCLEVMKLAAAESILARSDKGLDSKIGEGGLKLSGGEKQRLAIARALLRKPDLIIFDEATSSLDSLTENEIINTIREIEKARPEIIMVMVAHRLSTVAHAKTIYVLEKGKLIEHGNHEQLLKKKGLYAALWRQQVNVQ